MNTVENNKIIAEFMGCENPHAWELIPSPYECDWNWLIDVVDRCSQVSEDLNVTSLFRADLWMFHTKDIEAVYNACLEFIKWHNEQKSA